MDIKLYILAFRLIANYLYKTRWLVVSIGIDRPITCGCASIHIRKINIQITDDSRGILLKQQLYTLV